MRYMSVTLDVSRLSSWLNTNAPCRVTPRNVEGDTGGGKRKGGWEQWRCKEEPTAGHGTRVGVRT